MHTDSTLALLSEVTTTLGNTLRTFQERTCAAFPTRELQCEQVARRRRQVKKTIATAEPGSSEPKAQKLGNSARRPKQLNLNTYKFHSLGDYPEMIRRFGTIDSYSTQAVSFQVFLAPCQMRCLISIIYQSEREHRTSKGRHVRTNGRSIPQQLSKIEQRQRRIRMIRENLNGSHLQRDPEDIITDPNTSYNMGTSQNLSVHVPTFLQRNEGDPAIKVRIPISQAS